MVNDPEDTKGARNNQSDQSGSIDTSPDRLPTPTSDLPLKKKDSKKKWLVGIISVVAIVIIASIVYFLVNANNIAKQNEKDGQAIATQFASTKKLLDEATTNLKGSAIPLSLKDGLGGKTADGYVVYAVSSYKVGDRKYKNLPTASDGAAYKADSTTASADYASLNSFFERNKFKQLRSGKDETGPISWGGNSVPYVEYAVYESSDTLCMIWHGDASSTPLKSHIASVGCAEKSSYDQAAKVIDSFYAAYTRGEDSPAENIVLGVTDAGDGADGYKYAVLYQEDSSQLDVQFQGLYYLEPGKKEWTYFFGSNGLISCSEYNSDVLKKAFKDFECYNDATQAVAQVK